MGVDLRIIEGETAELELLHTDSSGSAIDISSGYNVDLHIYTDPDTVLIDKGTGLSGDDQVDVTTSGASGLATVTLTEADTLSLERARYIAEWRVRKTTGTEVVRKKIFTLEITDESSHDAD